MEAQRHGVLLWNKEIKVTQLNNSKSRTKFPLSLLNLQVHYPIYKNT